MAVGDLNDGSRFGLVPIGLPQAELDTGRSDTERRAFPSLATKGSVFAWTGTPVMPSLVTRVNVTGTLSDTVNLRRNVAFGGSSVDVPTWAAGCIVIFQMTPTVLNTSTYFAWVISVPIVTGAIPISYYEARVVPLGAVGEVRQITVPFFDEPLFTLDYTTNGTGTATYNAKLLGFVRNV